MSKRLWTARSSFKSAALDKWGKCAACGREHEAGAEVLLKTYRNRLNDKKVRLILCDDDCWREYDWNYWQAIASLDEGRAERLERLQQKALAEGHGCSANIVAGSREAKLEEQIEREEREAMANFEV
jgi:hypothetical protein